MAEFLGALTDEERAAFRAVGRVRRFAKGEAIFHEGDDAGGVVAVINGTVKVSLIGVGGREVVLRFSGPGELIGELAAVSDRPRTADVTAVDDVEAISVRAADFRRLALEHPRMGALVFENVAALLAEADRQRIDFATRDVTARIAGRLVELAESSGAPEDRGVRITLPLSQDELAAWSGASREAVARSLQMLRRLGWIETGRREIRVLDMEALRGLVG
ncbi:MAG: Crp/Fnr family transcriptional regulator [Solirubrobacteraceae bacterium]